MTAFEAALGFAVIRLFVGEIGDICHKQNSTVLGRLAMDGDLPPVLELCTGDYEGARAQFCAPEPAVGRPITRSQRCLAENITRVSSTRGMSTTNCRTAHVAIRVTQTYPNIPRYR